MLSRIPLKIRGILLAGSCWMLTQSSPLHAAPLFARDPAVTLEVERCITPEDYDVGRAPQLPATPKDLPPHAERARKPVSHGPWRPLHVTASAYALRGRTCQGTFTTHGTIAVDPRVIPYGSRIYVPGYGWGRALDT